MRWSSSISARSKTCGAKSAIQRSCEIGGGSGERAAIGQQKAQAKAERKELESFIAKRR